MKAYQIDTGIEYSRDERDIQQFPRVWFRGSSSVWGCTLPAFGQRAKSTLRVQSSESREDVSTEARIDACLKAVLSCLV